MDYRQQHTTGSESLSRINEAALTVQETSFCPDHLYLLPCGEEDGAVGLILSNSTVHANRSM